MAIGGDQGGSIRMPASFCGIYGMKPTHGLVPYTGIMPIEIYVDHTGPMTATVRDNALLLEVIAGRRRLRPAPVRAEGAPVHRGPRPRRRRPEDRASSRKASAMPKSERDVDAKVRKAAELLGKLGAKVTEVSIPWHTWPARSGCPSASRG